MLALSPVLRDFIRSEAEKDYPGECCGLILGTVSTTPEKGNPLRFAKTGLRIAPVRNARVGEDKRRRFSIEPRDFMRAEKEGAALGLEVVGIYHSHPDHPAIPSPRDLERALPFYSYAIVSVAGKKAAEFTNWILMDDRSAFEPEPLEFKEP
ncbi:MAG: M67 family metallopeptidase [Deltaproteobacteria bacterium]|jgi:proteasome lid subunit RPN8/RPN11|nr:M67 family metallopeptidase [Deltaproteobacteria bacterium]